MCSTSMAIREIHIKTLWDTIYPTEWPKLERLIIPSVGEEMEQLELSIIANESINSFK